MNLSNPKLSYIILSSNKMDDVLSYLYSREYEILEIKKYSNSIYMDSIIAYGDIDNDILRMDSIFISEHFNIDLSIVKYKNETEPKLIKNDGSERLLNIKMYSDETDNLFVYKGLSFSFTEKNRYWIPKNKTDFKNGMIIEYLNNNNQWVERVVEDTNIEWDNMYNIMLKYNKIRVKSNK